MLTGLFVNMFLKRFSGPSSGPLLGATDSPRFQLLSESIPREELGHMKAVNAFEGE